VWSITQSRREIFFEIASIFRTTVEKPIELNPETDVD